MRWSDRQQALLREMGLRLWGPAGPAGQPEAVDNPDTSTVVSVPRPVQPAAPAGQVLPRPVAAQAPAGVVPRTDAPATDLDWPGLRAAVAGCRACGLCESRRQTVFGVGHARAHCLIVGEAPGEHEDQQGEPFVGAAGQLLDRMLAALGLTRSEADPARQVFITNTLKCRPPRNRNPTPDELAACRPFLERQVALVQPQVILAMGRFAVQTLLGSDEAIGKLRGRLHDWHGVPLVVTYHPAYLLRQPADKARAWDDLCLAATCLASPA